MKEIVVPSLGESVTEAIVSKWHYKIGDFVRVGQILLELETDKVNLEVTSEYDGMIETVTSIDGSIVRVGAVLGMINTDKTQAEKAVAENKIGKNSDKILDTVANDEINGEIPKKLQNTMQSPAAAKILREIDANISIIHGTGKDGRITKADALMVGGESLVGRVENEHGRQAATLVPANDIEKFDSSIIDKKGMGASCSSKRRVPMTKLRQTIARRLKEAQNTAALLTTFNELDMSAIMKLRHDYQDKFQKRHGIKLGFMSFFVRAATKALAEFPIINATIDGNDIIYKDEYHIGVAVGTEKGLVVPVLRHADRMSLADIETEIGKLAAKARESKLTMHDLSGGTFSITNGGIYGSMLSTPIVNPPQSAILAMHNTTTRPVVVGNDIVARPMMYIALSYDHRIIDGREAVQFLVRIKEYAESPERLLLDI